MKEYVCPLVWMLKPRIPKKRQVTVVMGDVIFIPPGKTLEWSSRRLNVFPFLHHIPESKMTQLED
jgi:hypothetical protein